MGIFNSDADGYGGRDYKLYPPTTREMIREFSRAFGRPINESVVELSEAERLLLGKLLLEECMEYCFKGLGLELHSTDMVAWDESKFELKVRRNAKYDPIESADGLGDMNVVIHFNANWHGFNLDRVTAEIHDSNMSKLDANGKPIINGWVNCETCNGRGVELMGREYEPETCRECNGVGKTLLDPTKPTGKILKSPNFRKPDIAKVIYG